MKKYSFCRIMSDVKSLVKDNPSYISDDGEFSDDFPNGILRGVSHEFVFEGAYNTLFAWVYGLFPSEIEPADSSLCAVYSMDVCDLYDMLLCLSENNTCDNTKLYFPVSVYRDQKGRECEAIWVPVGIEERLKVCVQEWIGDYLLRRDGTLFSNKHGICVRGGSYVVKDNGVFSVIDEESFDREWKFEKVMDDSKK